MHCLRNVIKIIFIQYGLNKNCINPVLSKQPFVRFLPRICDPYMILRRDRVIVFGNITDRRDYITRQSYPIINLFVFFINFAGRGFSKCHVILIGRSPVCLT